MSTFRTLSLMVLAISLVACGTAGANTILFNDTFQSDTAGTAPGSIAGDLDPGAPAVGSWAVLSEVTATDIQVWNNLNPGNPANDAGTDKYLMLTRTNGTLSSATAWMGGWTASTTNNEIVELRASLYVDSGLATDSALSIVGTTSTGYAGRTFSVNFFRNGTIKYYTGSAFVTTTLAGKTNAWEDVVITANMATKTYTIGLDGGSPVNATWSGAATSVGFVGLGGGAEVLNRAFVDDLNLQIGATVPEPSTVALLVIGTFSLLCYAWRKHK